MIEVWEPRYRDKSVLLAVYRLPKEGDVEFKITKGFYAGEYTVSREDLKSAKREVMKTKKGEDIQMVSVPLEKIKKKENDG